MQGGVIRGISLLAILLSVGRAEELGDSKQSNVPLIKGSEFSIEDSGQSSNDTETSKAASEDLNNTNVTLGNNETNSIVEGSKNSTETRKAQHNVGDLYSFKNSPLSEFLVQHSSGTRQSNEKGPYVIDSQFNVEDELPVDRVSGSDDNIDKIPHLIPQEFAENAVKIVKSNANVQNTDIKSGHPTLHTQISKETKQIGKHNNSYYSGLNILPLYAAHLAATSNQVVPEKSHFSPLFSADATRDPVHGTYVDQANNLERENYQTLPSYFISKAPFQESRRDSKPEEIQTRNVDESQYSEIMNEHPYSPSSKSDSSSRDAHELRSGFLNDPSYSPYKNKGVSTAKAYSGAKVQSYSDSFAQNNQASYPYSFGYPPGLVYNPVKTVSANAQAQAVSSSTSAQSSTAIMKDAKSRVIWPNELIFPNKILGGEDVIQCTRETEMYHFWSRSFDCLVCICVNVHGHLEPLCAKCSDCRKLKTSEPQTFTPEQPPDSYVPILIPDPYVPLPIPDLAPSVPSIILEPEPDVKSTTSPPVREATCSPLPTERPFTNPLHPCQICICKETVTAFGKIVVQIECQDSHNCVLPPDVPNLPPIPNIPVPVPLPLCGKLPQHVSFPHPTDSCKQCKCSLGLSDAGLPEQQITCYHVTGCVTKIETTSEPITPPAPPVPIPVEPYPGFNTEQVIEPTPENYPLGPVSPPNAVTPEELIPWPPISTPAPPVIPLRPNKGPLPGPSPHDSCRPYPPNQPFQHPWDECQVCQCTETKSIGVVNVEISCYTKLYCCIEPPDQMTTAISETSGVNSEDNQAAGYGLVNGPPTSIFKPSHNPSGFQNQGYAGATAVVDNSGLYHGATQNQAFAEANSIAQNSDMYNPGGSTYAIAEANANSQDLENALYPGSHQSANAVSNVNGHTSAGTTAGYNNPSTLSPYNSKVSQNQAYAEANAVVQSLLSNYQPSASYQAANAEKNKNYSPLIATYRPSLPSQYNSGVPQSQGYLEGIAKYNKLVSTYKPPALYYEPYNADFSQNKAYAEAIAPYNDLMIASTPLYHPYNPRISQNQAFAEANAQYNDLMTSTYKPSVLYDQYNAEQSQNQVHAQANAQYDGLITNTLRPAVLYTGFNPAISQNQAHATANALYKGALSLTDKPPVLFNPYNTGGVQNQVYSEANAKAQNLLADKGYYLSGPYQTSTALGSVNNGGDESLAIAKAIAQSQGYSQHPLPNPLLGYPYQSKYYYQNPKYLSYLNIANSGLNGKYKPSPIKYAGNYELNGQADAINILSSSNSYNPYSSGYSQSVPASKLYPYLYPNQNNYEIIPSYLPGQQGSSNGQSTTQALAGAKSQSKSAQGYEEDSAEAKESSATVSTSDGSYEVSKIVAFTPYLMHINDLPNVAHFKDAEHRGPNWYDYSVRSKESASDLESGISSVSEASESKESTESQSSSLASSKETKERRKVTDMHRACTPCPHEMMKNFKNIGIKWICGGYQRARRTFKSLCMMRFRNCQDGTMFVKLADHKCGARNGPLGNATLAYHGKHWFYDYKV